VRAAEGNGNTAPLLARKVGEERDIAYIRLRNNLGDPALVMHFDAALQQMRDTRGMILDLRSTESGGTDEGVRALMGRFVEQESAWQLRARAGRPRETDRVAPRGPFAYRAPLVVLVDRWTAAEGEALAAGLDAAAGALLIGTRMAGLRGVRRDVVLPNTGLTLSFPAERAFHPNGTPREMLAPDIEVDLAKPSGGPGDPVLYQGLKSLEARRNK
jgi:C-terminal processing protease CtpA/Prc